MNSQVFMNKHEHKTAHVSIFYRGSLSKNLFQSASRIYISYCDAEHAKNLIIYFKLIGLVLLFGHIGNLGAQLLSRK